jgi:histidyl-tRNA synthetase
MASTVNPPRGMRDFLPEEKARREHVLSVIRRVFSAHGFDEIETPVMEDSARLHAGLGGDNEKLAFGVLKRGLTAEDFAVAKDALDLADLGLRFDLTVPLARFYATHRAELPTVFRAIQIAPVWRAERPQKGRYRQFVQCDIDIIGEAGPLAEIELLTATAATMTALGLTDWSIRVNDRRILHSLLKYWQVDEGSAGRVLVALDKEDKIGVEGVVAELRELGLGDADLVESVLLGLYRSPMTAGPSRTAAPSLRCGWTPTPTATCSRFAPHCRVHTSCSRRSSCAAWAITPARSSRSRTPPPRVRSAAAGVTTA